MDEEIWYLIDQDHCLEETPSSLDIYPDEAAPSWAQEIGSPRKQSTFETFGFDFSKQHLGFPSYLGEVMIPDGGYAQVPQSPETGNSVLALGNGEHPGANFATMGQFSGLEVTSSVAQPVEDQIAAPLEELDFMSDIYPADLNVNDYIPSSQEHDMMSPYIAAMSDSTIANNEALPLTNISPSSSSLGEFVSEEQTHESSQLLPTSSPSAPTSLCSSETHDNPNNYVGWSDYLGQQPQIKQEIEVDATDADCMGYATSSFHPEKRTRKRRKGATPEDDILKEIHKKKTKELIEAQKPTTTTVERKERRKKQNREAATRCRNKKKGESSQMQKDHDRIKEDNERLENEIEQLRNEAAALTSLLQNHRCEFPMSRQAVLAPQNINR